jgi:[lysine-biosynthesis-protein LysW]--L-2-aminoadipate ligase
MATVGVLCARSRREEKSLTTALAEAGIVSALFPPADEPLPINALSASVLGRPFPVPDIVVDRHHDRRIARAVLTSCRALEVPVLCAGIAATGDRLDVASALAAHGLPRPTTLLCTSEDAALQSVKAMGLPATVLPLGLESPGIALLDIDAAEAVFEHRAVLGGTDESLELIQAGAPTPDSLVTAVVVDGVAEALILATEMSLSGEVLRLAEEAARVLRADLVGIQIALGAGGPMIWDVQAVPEFRNAMVITESTVAEAITRAVARRLDMPAWSAASMRNVRDAVVSV